MGLIIRLLAGIAVLSILLIPIGFYIFQFGIGLWDNHSYWADMGSFFGGILGPLLTSASIVFLAYQLHLQTNEKNINTYENDILTFTPKLSKILKNPNTKDGLKKHIQEYNTLLNAGKISEANNLINKYMDNNFQCYTLWIEIDSSMKLLFEKSPFRYRRMRGHIFSECEIEDLAALNRLIKLTLKTNEKNCLFLDKQ